MKIAIQTLIGYTNYGCILQAYALQTQLEKMGHEVTILNRREGYPSFKLLLYRVLSFIKCLFRIIILKDKNCVICNPLNYSYIVRKDKMIDFSLMKIFTEKHLNYSPKFRTSYSLKKYVKRHNFDCYIVGSDQVWREIYVPNIYDSFLGYLSNGNKAKKIAYAASFGSIDKPISTKKLPICVNLAKAFDAISVREKSAVKYMLEQFNLSVTNVLDPTLLLDTSDYETIMENSEFGKDTMVSYILDENDDKSKIISECGKWLNCSHSELMNLQLNKNGIKTMKSVSEWLFSIANARFVVTDSFHGCVFSILFKKTFIVIANKERGLERFVSLLDLLGLHDRIVYTFEEFLLRKEQLFISPDYPKVTALLDIHKKNSIRYLFQNIG